MLLKFKCFLISNLIFSILLTLDAADNQYQDIIPAFRGPYQDPVFPRPTEKFYDEKISCDLVMDPMETIRTALNQLEVLRRSYCDKKNITEKEPINVPIKPSGSRSSNVPESEYSSDNNKGIEIIAISPKSDIRATENPNVLSNTMKKNQSTTRRRTFIRKPKKKCSPKIINHNHGVRQGPPFIFYEYYDDRETHNGYYEDEYYYDNNYEN